jgi:hypothetical protein
MEKSEIEYLISDIIIKTEDMVLLEWEIKNCITPSMVKLAKEELQLIYINRELSKQELMELGT